MWGSHGVQIILTKLNVGNLISWASHENITKSLNSSVLSCFWAGRGSPLTQLSVWALVVTFLLCDSFRLSVLTIPSVISALFFFLVKGVLCGTEEASCAPSNSLIPSFMLPMLLTGELSKRLKLFNTQFLVRLWSHFCSQGLLTPWNGFQQTPSLKAFKVVMEWCEFLSWREKRQAGGNTGSLFFPPHWLIASGVVLWFALLV